jgi:DNA-binding GntR family transcriptional regulator
VPAELTEQELRRRYGLTKSEAAAVLGRASQEGWAERKRGYGWRLLPVAKTAEAFEQICRFRAVVEPAAILEPSFTLDAAVLAAQRAVVEMLLGGGLERQPADRVLQLGAAFHEAIVAMSGNPFFHQAVVRVNRMRLLMEYRKVPDVARLRRQWTEHRLILELLAAGDLVGAAFTMRHHLGQIIRHKLASADRPLPGAG